MAFIKARVTPSFYTILECQVDNFNKHPKGRRYKDTAKALFLRMQKRGGAALRSLPFIKPRHNPTLRF